MHRSSAQAFFCPPGNRLPQRIIHLEDSRTVTICLKRLLEGARQTAFGNGEKLPRCHVAEKQVRISKTVKGSNRGICQDTTAQRMKHARKRVRNGLRAALGNGPANRMPRTSQNHAERGGERHFQLKNRVSRYTGKQS